MEGSGSDTGVTSADRPALENDHSCFSWDRTALIIRDSDIHESICNHDRKTNPAYDAVACLYDHGYAGFEREVHHLAIQMKLD